MSSIIFNSTNVIDSPRRRQELGPLGDSELEDFLSRSESAFEQPEVVGYLGTLSFTPITWSDPGGSLGDLVLGVELFYGSTNRTTSFSNSKKSRE